jgi:hypothetical protein
MPEQTEEPSERGVPAPDTVVEWLAERLDASLTSVAGYTARVDAGEKAQIWIALKGAIDDPDAEHGLMQALEARVDDLREEASEPFELEVSTGRMDEDVVMRCRVLEPTSGSEES